MLRSKIHRAHVTNANLNYEGSITIDKKIMEAVDILPYEQVDVLNINNGARFTTYAIEGMEGEICINGPAARLATPEDIIIILTYQHVEENEASNILPKLVYVDEKNAITKIKQEIETVTV